MTIIEPKAQAVSGAVLATTQWWSPALDAIQTGAQWVTLIGGAIIAAHGVYRIFRPRPPK
jgi:predicted phage tail protein